MPAEFSFETTIFATVADHPVRSGGNWPPGLEFTGATGRAKLWTLPATNVGLDGLIPTLSWYPTSRPRRVDR